MSENIYYKYKLLKQQTLSDLDLIKHLLEEKNLERALALVKLRLEILQSDQV